METLKIYVEDSVYFGETGAPEGDFVSPYVAFIYHGVILAKAESGWTPSLARSPAFALVHLQQKAA